MSIYRLIGQIVAPNRSSAPSSGQIRVEALDADGQTPDLLAVAIADAAGNFAMTFESDHLKRILGDRRPAIAFRLVKLLTNATSVLSASEVVWRPSTDESTIRIQLTDALPSSATGTAAIVRGTVRKADGEPVPSAIVRVFDVAFPGVGSDVQLGEYDTSNSVGAYAITYAPSHGTSAWNPAPNLVVRAWNGSTLIAESEVQYNALPTLELDLVELAAGETEYVGPSEHADVRARALQVIPSSFDLKTATSAQRARISAASDSRPEHVDALVAAEHLANASFSDIDAEIFYGLLRHGLPSDDGALLLTGQAGIREALKTARDGNTIAKATSDATITDALSELRAKIIDNTFPGTATPVGSVLTTVLNETDARSFLDAYLSHEGPLDEFWTSSSVTSTYPVADIQFALQSGLLSRFHAPLVSALKGVRTANSSSNTFQTLRDFAVYTAQDWHDLIGGISGGNGAPTDMVGADTNEKKANYAAYLRRSMEVLFPTASIAGDVSRASDTASQELTAHFFPAHQGFEFGKHRVDEYFADNSVTGVNAEGKTRLKHLERLFRLTPRYSEMEVLLNDGLHSAREVVRIGHEAFISTYGASNKLGNAAIAETVWANARSTASRALALHSKYGASMNPTLAAALPDFTTRSSNPDPSQDANWSLLFGSQDFCDCTECASVYGAPAYLVDLLDFLARSSAELDNTTVTAREVLLDRRPDIANIELTCENTLKPLPYVDLVNEILEYAVVGAATGNQPAFPSHIKTDGAPEDLKALPEVQDNDNNASTATPHETACDILRQKVHPWSLPFDLATSEARVYLTHLGVPRDEMMRALQRASGSPVTYTPTDQAIAAERLGLSPNERLVITGAAFPPSPATPASIQALWGLPEAASTALLKGVPTFLAASGWSFDELTELIDTAVLRRFCGSSGPSLSAPAGSACKVDDMTIAGLQTSQEDAAWAFLHRFGRLQRRLGYSIREMDQMVTAFETTIDDTFLVGLATAERLRARLGVSVSVAASWFGKLDVRPRDQGKSPSFYEQVYQNKAVAAHPDPGLSLDAIASSSDTVSAHVDGITSALGITAYELGLLTDGSVTYSQFTGGTSFSNPTISLTVLSWLHRIVTLARALRMPLVEFLILDDLAGKPVTGQFSSTGGFIPANVERFVDTVDRIRRSGFKLAELRYLFENIPTPNDSQPGQGDAMDATLQTIYANLLTIYQTQIVATDPTGSKLRALVAVLGGDESGINDFMAFVERGDTPGDPAMDPSDYFQNIAPFLWDPTTVSAGLIGTNALTDSAERFTLVYSHMSIFILGLGSVSSTLAGAFDLDQSLASGILMEVLTASGGGPLAFAFAVPVLNPMPDPLPVPTTARDAYRHFEKALMIIRRLGIGAKELSVCVAQDDSVTPPAKLFDFDALSRGTERAAASPVLFAALETLIDLLPMRESMPQRGDDLADFLRAQSSYVVPRLRDILSWPQYDLEALTDGSTGLGLTFGGPVSNAKGLLRLRDAMAAVKRIGVPAATALGWAQPVTLAGSAAVVQAARAKHTQAAWAEIAPPLRDVLREKQRDALADYLVIKGGHRDRDDLFGALLIDVEMAPIQLTSRIKQAIGSVQTFIQRAFLNLEPGVALGEEAAREWEWRKNYRVWEANRQIFLYPENWILPELRDDKSPFFQDLEQALRQKDITDEAAEKAFAGYLEKLERVSNLEVMAAYHQKEEGTLDREPIDVLHVIARTRHDPAEIYYRTRVDGTHWTPWELVDIEVPSYEMVLAVVNRRPHLFWPLVERKDDEKTSTKLDDPKPPTYQLEIKLGWSEYRSGKWTAPRVSTGDPILFRPTPQMRWRWISLLLQQEEPSVVLNCVFNPSGWTNKYEEPVWLGFFALNVCNGEVQASSEDMAATKYTGWVHYSKSPLRFGLTMPHGMTQIFQDATFLPPGGLGKLKIDLVENDVLQPTVVLGDVGSPRVLLQHDVGETAAGAKDLSSSIEWFFMKDAEKAYFAELVTTTPNTSWSQGGETHPSYSTLIPPHDLYLGSDVISWTLNPPSNVKFTKTTVSQGYRFHSFYHPHACAFLAALRRGGVSGLLRWPLAGKDEALQFRDEEAPTTWFQSTYAPTSAVVKPYPREAVDFSFGGAYSLYNWEVFFHIPFLIAVRLMENQRFEEARKWFHYIFDPTTGASAGKTPQRFWKVKPFYENKDLATIQDDLALLAGNSAASVNSGSSLADSVLKLKETLDRMDMEAQISAWEKDPFNPHHIARMRPIAYQKTVVMKYIQNLIAWGDQLFARDTLESINEATQLYILAGHLLGKRPRKVKPASQPEPKTYAELASLDLGTSHPLLETESLVLVRPAASTHVNLANEPPPVFDTITFCVPPDDMLLSMWDTVADRLFKIRHSMNLEGVVRELPLFEPPIDPALLVAARAAGVNIASVLNDAPSYMPKYRFSVMHAKAMELSSGLASFGGMLLSALEKRDGEELSRLRQTQEIEMLRAVKEVKKQQLEEAKQNLAGLEKALESATIKHQYYATVMKISFGEAAALELSAAAATTGILAQGLSGGASSAKAAPMFLTGTAGFSSPVTISMEGGEQVGSAMDSESHGLSVYSGALREMASAAATLAGYERRWDDYKLQEKLTSVEMKQIQKQIAAANIRVALAENELANHELQMDHAQQVDEYLRSKFTNEALYDWMVGQLSTVYFQAYGLAYETAKRAEKAYRFERGVESSSYIAFGYWDGIRKGLLAGERLQHDLRRLEMAYLDQNAREYEITKHVSLASLAPEALMTLKDTGACTLSIEEKHLDLDYPGHYMRRIKSVSVTIPALTGPYTGVNCTLRLTGSSVRTSTKDSGTSMYARNDPGGQIDSRFAVDYVPVTQTIATSSAQNDGGLFELNFRDERYLPFEGAGAISDWEIRLPNTTNGFDVSVVTDVILHVRYTARDGGDGFRDDVATSVAAASPRTGQRLFSVRTEFPEAWTEFVSSTATPVSLELPIDSSMFPHVFGNAEAEATHLTVYGIWSGHTPYSAQTPVKFTIAGPGISSPSTEYTLGSATPPAKSNTGKSPLIAVSASTTVGTWTLSMTATLTQTLRDTLQDIYVIVDYSRHVGL